MISMNPRWMYGDLNNLPIPSRWHRCRVIKVRPLVDPGPDNWVPERVGVCQCGAIRWIDRHGWPRWTNKNARRRDQ